MAVVYFGYFGITKGINGMINKDIVVSYLPAQFFAYFIL